MPDYARSDEPPPLTTEALATACTALVAFAAGPYDDAGITGAAALAADAAIYLDTAARKGGLTSVSTISTVTACLAMTAGEVSRLLPWAGDWLSAEITAGRVIGEQPLPELAANARTTLETAAARAAHLASALQAAHDLTATLRQAGETAGPVLPAVSPAPPAGARGPKPLLPRDQLSEDAQPPAPSNAQAGGSADDAWPIKRPKLTDHGVPSPVSRPVSHLISPLRSGSQLRQPGL